MQRDIEDIVETLKKAKDRNKACTLLIGAGCSVKAGIPLANEFVEIIRNEYPRKYGRAEQKNYPHCMSELSMGERRDLISRYIDTAQINWAHIGIAQLMKHGFVDRVLTVNFDPLLQRACAMVGVFPAVYDFAASQYFNPGFISDLSIFHLHGQRTGFVVLNTLDEVNKLSKHLEPVFEDSLIGRVCIVVGYSGESDPVFNHLAAISRFDNNLYWACFKDSEPPIHVREKLLLPGKDAFYVNGFDADDFFVTLAQRLNCFPPDFVGKPFSHLAGLIQTVTPYSIPGQTISVADSASILIEEAIEMFERRSDDSSDAKSIPTSNLALKARNFLLAGDYDQVISLEPAFKQNPTNELGDAIAWAYVAQGNEVTNRAKEMMGEDADLLFEMGYQKYESALRIKPDMHEVLYNWGTVLFAQAEMKSGAEADRLFAAAYEKYEAALKIKPDMDDVSYNWGTALAAQAKMKTGAEADGLFAAAYEKYEAALKIKPDMDDVSHNWGNALHAQARMKTGAEADGLFAAAYQKYEAALKIKPDMPEGLYNWGTALISQAAMKTGEEAERLFAAGYAKYEAALKIKPDKHEAFNNWGTALISQAEMKTGEEADQLFAEAYEKYQAALKIKPDKHDALYNWGTALYAQAKTKTGEEADRLFAAASEKYEAVLKIKPDRHEALNNWGTALISQAKMKTGEEADRLFAAASEKYEAVLKIKPDKHEAFYNWGNALYAQAEMKTGEESDRLFAAAYEKYEATLKIKPDKYQALYNWGSALYAQAEMKSGEEAANLKTLGKEKIEIARGMENG